MLNITDNLIDIRIFKLCPPDTYLPLIKQTSESPTGQSTSTYSFVPFRIHLQLVGDNDPSDLPRHYPQCTHYLHPDTLTVIYKSGTDSFEEGSNIKKLLITMYMYTL